MWLDDRHDAAFDALDQALAQYRLFERVCREENPVYTAPLVQLVHVNLSTYHTDMTAADLPEDWPWWDVPEADAVKAQMQADPRWNEWARRCGALR